MSNRSYYVDVFFDGVIGKVNLYGPGLNAKGFNLNVLMMRGSQCSRYLMIWSNVVSMAYKSRDPR